MNPKKCRKMLNAIALLVIIIVFLSNIPLFNLIHKEMCKCQHKNVKKFRNENVVF